MQAGKFALGLSLFTIFGIFGWMSYNDFVATDRQPVSSSEPTLVAEVNCEPMRRGCGRR